MLHGMLKSSMGKCLVSKLSSSWLFSGLAFSMVLETWMQEIAYAGSSNLIEELALC